MRGFPRRNMFRLAQAIMVACVAALGTPLRGEGAPPLLSPGLIGATNVPAGSWGVP